MITEKNEMRNDVLERLPEILDHISDLVCVFDREGRFVWINRACCDVVNIPRNEIIGKPQKQLVEEGHIRGSVVYEAIRQRKEVSGMVGTGDIEVLTRCRPIFNDNGDLQFVVGTSTNMKELNTLRVKLEKERRKSEKYLREIEHLRKVLLLNGDFIFESSEMRALLDDLSRVAPFDYTILITGESGVGKDVIAKTIHLNSSRGSGPFIPVCIPAIPANLLESELFGYEGGTFTGSLPEGKMGLLEVAQGGTLFLDEVGDIPKEIQVKILRAIETNEIRKVGSTKTIRLNVRIIAATNRPLDQMMKNGMFREDLYYRLNVVPIHVKPLRERPEDILPLCDHFLQEINNKYHQNKTISREALAIMQQHQWPGNIRELKHVVERLSVLSNGDLIIPEDVHKIFNGGTPACADEQPVIEGGLVQEFEVFEKRKILEVLKQTRGNKKRAAEMMGMTRTRFYRRLAKYS